MLKKSCRLLLHKLRNHIAQYSSNGVEPLVCRADIVQSVVIKEDLLHDEDGHSLAEL